MLDFEIPVVFLLPIFLILAVMYTSPITALVLVTQTRKRNKPWFVLSASWTALGAAFWTIYALW